MPRQNLKVRIIAQKTYSIGISLVVCFLQFGKVKDSVHPTQIGQLEFFLVACILITFFIFVQFLTRWNSNVNINLIDILVVGVLGFITIASYKAELYESLAKCLSYAILYIGFRLIHRKDFYFITLGFLLAGILQSALGIFQFFGVFRPNSSEFLITGSFFNPGPFSGYLSSVFPISVGIISLFKNKPYKSCCFKVVYSIAAIYFLLVAIALPLTNSRAAWIAALLSAIYIISFSKKVSDFRITRFQEIVKRFLPLFLFLLFGLCVTVLFFLKVESAKGRLLIWQISTKMIKENLLTGMGHEKFKANYMIYQSDYFFKHKNLIGSSELADNIEFPYNEYLRIIIEYGLLGVMALVSGAYLLFFAMKTMKESAPLIISRAGIISVGVFSIFSYPSEIIPIMCVLLFYISICSKFGINKRCYFLSTIRMNIFTPALLTVFVILLHYTVNYTQAIKNWSEASVQYKKNNFIEANKFYSLAKSSLKGNGLFLSHYAKSLSVSGKYESSNFVGSEAIMFLNNTYINLILGENYEKLGDIKAAERYYNRAIDMVPSQIYPKYCLALLFISSKQIDKAKLMADEIIFMKYKIESPAVVEMKNRMIEFKQLNP